MSSRGKLFIVSAPAGSGKTTLVEMVCNEMKNCERSISCTTRSARGVEMDGIDYFFVSDEEFEKRSLAGDFLEEAQVYQHRYGTLKSFVEERLAKGIHVFLVIDTQGALQLKGNIEGIWIFVAPPDLQTLRERLEKRGTESQEDVEKRLSWAKKELERSAEYDYVVVNDELKQAFEELKSIIYQK